MEGRPEWVRGEEMGGEAATVVQAGSDGSDGERVGVVR